jgi:hypothetical protein
MITLKNFVRFEVPTVKLIRIQVIWFVKHSIRVFDSQRLGGK